jgi:serine/alanine adding enzyme
MDADCTSSAGHVNANELRAKLKEEMGRLSRRIGEARQRGDDVHHLVAQMRLLSQEHRLLAQNAEPDAVRAVTNDTSAARRAVARLAEDAAADARRKAACSYANPLLPADAVRIAPTRSTVAEWDAYTNKHPRGSLYHLHCWKPIIELSFGNETCYLEARDAEDRLRGVLPLVRQRSRVFGDHLVSLPFVTYGGAIADSAAVEDALMQHAGTLAREMGSAHVEFRDTLPRTHWRARTEKFSLRLALPDNAETLWQGFTSKLRAQIRRGEREHARAEIGGRELLPDFYRVFARNMRDLGTPVYSRTFFEHIFDKLPCAADAVGQHARAIVVYLRGRPVAGAVLLGYRRMLEIPWASSLREVNPLGINMVLYWRVMQHAIESGHTVFDFGRSTRDAGTYRFKRQWGAGPVPLHWHYWMADSGDLPQLNPQNPKYRLAIAAWQHLPLWAANMIGPKLVKNLP